MTRWSVSPRFGTTAKVGNSRWMSVSRSSWRRVVIEGSTSGIGGGGVFGFAGRRRSGASLEKTSRRGAEAGGGEGRSERAAGGLDAVDGGDEESAVSAVLDAVGESSREAMRGGGAGG